MEILLNHALGYLEIGPASAIRKPVCANLLYGCWLGCAHPLLLVAPLVIVGLGGGSLIGGCLLQMPQGNMDNKSRFFRDLPRLSRHEQRLVVTVLLLAQLLDGDFGSREREMWESISILPSIGEVACYDAERLHFLAYKFRSRQFIDVPTLYGGIEPMKPPPPKQAFGVRLERAWNRFTQLISG